MVEALPGGVRNTFLKITQCIENRPTQKIDYTVFFREVVSK